jgi:hypothetical protein
MVADQVALAGAVAVRVRGVVVSEPSASAAGHVGDEGSFSASCDVGPGVAQDAVSVAAGDVATVGFGVVISLRADTPHRQTMATTVKERQRSATDGLRRGVDWGYARALAPVAQLAPAGAAGGSPRSLGCLWAAWLSQRMCRSLGDYIDREEYSHFMRLVVRLRSTHLFLTLRGSLPAFSRGSRCDEPHGSQCISDENSVVGRKALMRSRRTEGGQLMTNRIRWSV